jgi:hypothetical protein
MSSAFSVDASTDSTDLGSASETAKVRPNFVDVGAWLDRSRVLREPVDYLPRHRAAGLAV